MTLEKLIYDVRESMKDYVDDSTVDDRYITYLINNKRSKLVGQDLDRQNTTVDEGMKQNFCISLERVSAVQCGMDLGCEYVYRTNKVIPEPMDLKHGPAIIRVSSANLLDKPYSLTSRERAAYHSESPFNTIPAAFYHNDGYIYLTGQDNALKLLNKINVTGVFENPAELMEYTTETGQACFDFNTFDYPIPTKYIEVITNEVVRILAGAKMMPNDETNNGQEDGNK